MTQLSYIYGAYPVNNQILVFDAHGSHFDNPARTQMKRKNIQPFILKLDNSINNQHNENGYNKTLKDI